MYWTYYVVIAEIYNACCIAVHYDVNSMVDIQLSVGGYILQKIVKSPK